MAKQINKNTNKIMTSNKPLIAVIKVPIKTFNAGILFKVRKGRNTRKTRIDEGETLILMNISRLDMTIIKSKTFHPSLKYLNEKLL